MTFRRMLTPLPVGTGIIFGGGGQKTEHADPLSILGFG